MARLRHSPPALMSAPARVMLAAGSSMADYVIVYFKGGSHLGSSPWSGDLDAAKKLARDGLIWRGADAFQIRSNTLDGPVVWQEQRDC